MKMGVVDDLKALGGACPGGVALYHIAERAAQVAALGKPRRKLRSTTIAVMKPYFANLDLARVKFCINVLLPAQFIGKHPDGMTFGYTIFFRDSNIQKSRAGLALLLHELVHVDQVRRRSDSEDAFACDYGVGLLQAGGNEVKNPLEAEAYDLVNKNYWNLPDGVNKPQTPATPYHPANRAGARRQVTP